MLMVTERSSLTVYSDTALDVASRAVLCALDSDAVRELLADELDMLVVCDMFI